MSLVSPTQARLGALGYNYSVAAGSADVHTLPATHPRFSNERLHVMLLSKLPLRQASAVPMLDGNAAFADVHLPAAMTGAKEDLSVMAYSVHLSVRCKPAKRQREIASVLAHAKHMIKRQTGQLAHGKSPLVLIAGDMNQPNANDYPAAEWQVIKDDMAEAGLSPTDGVMPMLRSAGFTPSFEIALNRRPLPASTAWNGAVVDYCYVRRAQPASKTNFEVEASYAYYTTASDHLPIVTDFVVSPNVNRSTSRRP